MARGPTMTALLSRVFAMAVIVVAPIVLDEAFGQGAGSTPNAMQGFVQNRDQPVRIEAAILEMRDKKKEATFSGNVKVVQGDTTMTSKVLVVFYEDKAAQPSTPADTKGAKGDKSAKATPSQSATPAPPPGPGGSSSIKRLEAKGSVVVTQKDQTVTGETAIFDAKANLITVLGGGGVQVVLTQCSNVLRGDRLRVDMTTGVSRVDSESTGKVTATTGSGGQDCGTPAGAAPSAPLAASGKAK
ncbi:LPS ABC transporter substrate-binding protein LptA [Bradyrhizobium sp. Arg68]|nr:LPS ABC transporter substrate-binding protein LptA [Bradyrhizobium ivorense]